MPKQVTAIPPKNAGRPAKYDYDRLFDGGIYEIDAEELGKTKPSAEASNLRTKAASRGIRATVAQRGGSVFVQAHPNGHA